MVKQKITLRQITRLTKYEGEMGAHLEDILPEEIKIVVTAYKKICIMLEEVKETKEFEGHLETLTEIKKNITAYIQTFEKSYKTLQVEQEKMSDIFEDVRKKTGFNFGWGE